MTQKVERAVLEFATDGTQQFLGDTAKVEKALEQLLDAFRGTAKSVKPAGDEVDKFGNKLKGAIPAGERYTRSMKDAAGATSEFGGVMKAANNVAGAFGLTLSVAGLVAFGKSVVARAGELADMSATLGVSTKFLQQHASVARQSGSSLETYGKGVFQMSMRIASGGDEVNRALRDLKLNVAAIRAESPESQFEQVTSKLAAITQEGERNRLGVALFGKAWEEMAPGIISNIDDVRRAAVVASDASIQMIDKYSDKVDEFFENLKNRSIEGFGKFLERAEKVRGFTGMFGPLGLLAPEIADLAGVKLPLPESPPPPDKPKRNPPPPSGSSETDRRAKDATELATKWSRLAVDQEIQKWLAAAKEFVRLGLVPTDEAIEDVTMQVEKWIAAGHDVPDMLRRVRDENLHLIYALVSLEDQTDKIIRQQPNLIAGLLKSGEAARDLARAAFNRRANELVRPTEVSSFFENALPMGQLVAQGEAARQRASSYFNYLKPGLKSLAMEFPQSLATALLHNQGLKQAFRSMAVTSAATVGQAWGQAIADSMKKSASFFAQMLPGLMGSAFSIITSSIERIVTSTVNNTKKERERFAKDQGFRNLDALYDQLKKTGDAGAKLADIGLNVIGRKDAAANQKWMQDVLELLSKQKDEVESLTPTWEQLVEIMNEYGISMDAAGKITQQAALAKQANKAVLDFKKLIAAGASFNGVLVGMSDELQGMVTQALRFGLEVPESMRPMLQGLIDMGLITDENGEKLKDLSRINFSQSIQSAIQHLIDKLDQFIARLLGGVPNALAKLGVAASMMPVAVGAAPAPRMPVQLPDYTMPDFSVASFDTGTGGRYLGQDVLAKVHKGEAVVKPGGSSELARDIAKELSAQWPGGTMPPVVNVFIGNEQFKDYVVETNTRALERNDSGGRPVSHRMRVQKALGVKG